MNEAPTVLLRQFLRHRRGDEFWVQVAGYRVHAAVCEADEVFGGFLQETAGFHVFHVADVLADECFILVQYAGGVVEFAA